MKIKLPSEIENLKDGPHKRDMIRHYKKMELDRNKILEKYIKKQPDEDIYKEVVKILRQEQKKAKRKDKNNGDN